MDGVPHKDAFISIEVVHFVDREFEKFEKLSTSERERLREVIMEKFKAIEEAQELAYRELQRRLDMLNHAHEEAKQKENHYLPRENFEQFFKDFGTWRDTVNGTLSNQVGSARTWIFVAGGIVALIQIALHFWR